MTRRTVGVAPGTFTVNFGAPPTMAPNSWQMLPPTVRCPPDGYGTGAYGVPSVNWYGYSVPGAIGPGEVTQGPPASSTAAPLYNPYGTESELKDWHDKHRKAARLAGLGLRGQLTRLGDLVPNGTLITQPMQQAANTRPQWQPNANGGEWIQVPTATAPPVTLPIATDTPWWQQWYIIGPIILAVGFFGWKKLSAQHAAVVPTAPHAA